MKRVLVVTAMVAIAVAAQAKTVALWPLEADANIGRRCVVDPKNDLTKVDSHFVAAGESVEWELPPNPDTDRHAFEPINSSAVREKLEGTQNGFLYNHYTARHLRRDKAFTIEGWIKVFDLPTSNNWACILCVYGSTASDGADNNRWTFSLRRRSNEDYACSWMLWGNGSQDTVLYRYADEEASYAITNTWIHIALTHAPLGANKKDHWTLFLNGVQAGESENAGSVTNSYAIHRFDLGARGGNLANQINAAFDYWRISDKVLEPSEFLCAGESGTTVTASHTVSYWPLGVTETGGVDCRDAVGTSPLTGGFYGTQFTSNRMTPVEDSAFAGNPPNSTVTLSGGNAGSFLGSATSSCLQNDAVGEFLNVTSNFTVEGWFCPRICERATKAADGETACQLFGTRPDYGHGWAFQYRANGIGNAQFDVYCKDGADQVPIQNVKLSGSFDVSSWYDEWRHLALTYNATGGASGHGLWTLYIDGVQVGSAANSRTPVAITSARPFNLGGRVDIADQSFQGKIDCVRVCATVLSPNQFLNATNNPAAATDVVAFWPLNVINGVFPDLRDVSGTNHFASLSYYPASLVTPDSDNQPTISNPDRTPTFRGDPSKVNGSVRFRNPDAATDNSRANLFTGSSDVMKAMGGGKDFTFEFYYLPRSSTKPPSGDNQTFMGYSTPSDMQIRFFHKVDGFYIWEKWNATISDTKFPGTADSDLEKDRWHHVALVHSIESVGGVNKSMWRLYIEGELKGTVSGDYNNKTATCTRLFVGGRYTTANNAIVGNLSSVRLSNCALDPSDFLCATPVASEQPEPTAGYWPIDSTVPGLANLAYEDYPLEADGTALGQNDRARPSIPNRSAITNVVTRAARQNHGSYALGAGGVLAAASIGFDMAGPKSFTVEGWLKWSPSEGTADEDLIIVGDALTYNGGLRIFFDKTGETPKLRVFARGAWPCTPYVDGAFDADWARLVGTWTHLAIAYDANDGEGSWTLYVEGKQAGNKVKNFYRPTPVDYSRGGEFQIGSTAHPLSAAVDMWRVSTVVCSPIDFLYAPPRSMTINFR